MTATARGVGLLTLVLVLLLGSGCGSSDETDSETPSIDKASFIRKTSEICRKSQQRIIKAAVPAARKGPQEEGETQYELEAGLVRTLLIPNLRREIDEIRELGTPPGDEAEIRAFLSGIEEAVREAETEPETYIATGGNYVPGRLHYRKALKVAAAYGLQGCPQG